VNNRLPSPPRLIYGGIVQSMQIIEIGFPIILIGNEIVHLLLVLKVENLELILFSQSFAFENAEFIEV
jgi:hypothetical protein